jgi:hypothetical protein
MQHVFRTAAAALALMATFNPAGHAADEVFNYDEANVRHFTLPDPLAGPDGVTAITPEAWHAAARPHQLSLVEATIYGRRLPAVPVSMVGDVERADVTLPGDVAATRLQARLRLGTGERAPTTDVLLYLPRGARAVPCFLCLNFRGNQAQHPDPGIRLANGWVANDPLAGITDNRATEASRGSWNQEWPVETMLGRGYCMATAYYGDTFPDRPDGRPESALASLGRPVAGQLPPDEPGAIATWAWQLSRILDWLVTLPEIDKTKVAVVGHSRLGKTALFAGALDERFAMVVSNESGCGGAALSRRNYGESVRRITTSFPHWFCPAFATFAGRETELPCDQHTLLALLAPRTLYVSSAIDDRWADPRGEFLSAVAAEPAWKLFGLRGLGTAAWPAPDTPIGATVGYHVRSGRHELLAYDWERFADHADRHLLGRKPPEADGYPAFAPVQSPLPVPPPAGAVVLVGADAAATAAATFTSMTGGPIDWRGEQNALVVAPSEQNANHIISKETFRDADIHAEFMVSPDAKGNSGLYLHGHYEMQIYDSCGVTPVTDQDEGSLYRFAKPIVNAARPAGEWQVYDIRFIAPRRDKAGTIVAPGRVTAWLNGRLVQNELTFTEPRSPYTPYKHGVTEHLRAIERRLLETGEGPLFLQDHGSPTRFRNVWIKPLGTAARETTAP